MRDCFHHSHCSRNSGWVSRRDRRARRSYVRGHRRVNVFRRCGGGRYSGVDGGWWGGGRRGHGGDKEITYQESNDSGHDYGKPKPPTETLIAQLNHQANYINPIYKYLPILNKDT